MTWRWIGLFVYLLEFLFAIISQNAIPSTSILVPIIFSVGLTDTEIKALRSPIAALEKLTEIFIEVTLSQVEGRY